MKRTEKRYLLSGLGLLAAFGIWTGMIRWIDVQPVGPDGSVVGFAAFNAWFHRITGVHMSLYTVTDWLGLVPILICFCFGILGAVQLFRRKNLRSVDPDILLLGVGVLEASYPSSTTLLVLSVMPTLAFQAVRRSTGGPARKAAAVFAWLFSAFMVIGRLVAGVHWVTDIIGSVLLSFGLFMMYRFAVSRVDRKKAETSGRERNHGIQ